MRIAYFDCFAGASGDMILGALLDCGLPLDVLRAELAKVPLGGYRISTERAKRGPLSGTRVTVAFTEPSPEHRSLAQILDIIAACSLPQRVREQAAAIFSRLGAAEAKVHGIAEGDVEFHEVGATDALVDILGSVIALNLLGVEAVFASPLPVAGGSVGTVQGTLPLPAPATLELLARAGAPLHPSPDPDAGELVTPTGAAVISTLASFQQPRMTLERVGYGVGARELATLPNVLRLWIGHAPSQQGQFLLLETNIDDMNPELYGYVQERLFTLGALDVWLTPVQMKKGRPAVVLSVLAPAHLEGAMVDTLLRETSTLGVRVRGVERWEAEREVVEVDTSLGTVRLKLKRLQGAPLSVSPEYEDCRLLALEHGLPLQEVYRIVAAEASARLLHRG